MNDLLQTTIIDTVRVVAGAVAVSLVLGCSRAPDTEDCRRFLSDSATRISVSKVNGHSHLCSGTIGFLPVQVTISKRSDGRWFPDLALVDGEPCISLNVAACVTEAMTADQETCEQIFGSGITRVNTIRTPAGSDGCMGRFEQVPVVVEASRAPGGWTVTRSWVDDDEVPADRWQEVAEEIHERKERELAQRTAQRDQEASKAKSILLKRMRDAAIEKGQMLHPMSELTNVYVESESVNERSFNELRLNCYYTLKFKARMKNFLSGSFKHSTVRVQVVGELYSRPNVPWDGHVEAVKVLSNT